MKKLLCLILAILVPLQGYASCPNPVTSLEQGAQAPCRGFLFSPEKEKEVRLLKEDFKLLEQEVEIKNKKINIMLKDLTLSDSIIEKEREKGELWRITAEKSTLELVKVNENQGNRDLLMILLGVVVTVGAGYAVGQAAK